VERCRDLLHSRGLMQLTMDKEMFTKEEMKMVIDSHVISLGRSHNKRKENAREIGKKKMSQEEREY